MRQHYDSNFADDDRLDTFRLESAHLRQGGNRRAKRLDCRTSYVCPEPKGPGTLLLGPSNNPGEICPAYSFSVNSVTITPAPLHPSDACTRLGKVNGLMVYVTPCSSSNAAGITEWTVPSLGVQAVATQAGGSSVGSGSSTVVGRVLHTLRKG
jgi:hypothetical protein